jgi:hypothetical protein
MLRTLCFVLALAAAFPAAATAQGLPVFPTLPGLFGGPAVKTQRSVVTLNHLAARDAAATLRSTLRPGEGTIAVDERNNALILNAPEKTLAELAGIVEKLDVARRTVVLEVVTVELFQKKSTPSGIVPVAVGDFDETDWRGPMDQIVARLESLKKDQRVGEVRRLRFTTLESQKTRAGETTQKSVLSGVRPNPSNTKYLIEHQLRQIGLVVEATPAVLADNRFQVKLCFEETRLHTPDDALMFGVDASGQPIRAMEVVTSVLQTVVNLPSGQASLLKSLRTTSTPVLAKQSPTAEPGQHLLLFVSATLEAAPK